MADFLGMMKQAAQLQSKMQELQAELGRPGHKRPDRQGGEVWSWRHESPFCLWFQASINVSGRVGSASFAPDPRCEFHDGQ